MSVIQKGSTTTPYNVTNSYGVSSSTTVSSTTGASQTPKTGACVTAVTTTTKCSQATLSATCSATLIYGGASSTVKTIVRSSTQTASNTLTASSTLTAKSTASSTPTASTTPTVSTASTASTTPTATASGTNYNTVKATNTGNLNMCATATPYAVTTSYSNLNASATPSGSNTLYSYIAHMGGEAQLKMENMLVAMGFDDKADGNFSEALNKFNSVYHADSYIYSSKVANKINEVYALYEEIHSGDSTIAAKLGELGFYNENGALKVDSLSTYADSVSCNLYDAIKNFCNLYGVKYEMGDVYNVDDFVKKVNEVYSCYEKVLNSDNLDKIFKELGIDTEIQRVNFSKSWTFLKVGMGFGNDLAAAVMANWYEEGAFSETNRQDIDGVYKIDDSETYNYDKDDRCGWGIMQWTFPNRKNDLLDMAKEMNSGVGNINVQFALFMAEISDGGSCDYAWNVQVMSANEVKGYTSKFMIYMENPADQSEKAQNRRINNAEIIKNGVDGRL